MSAGNVRAPLRRSRLRPGDLFGLGTSGIRARPLRAVLSALGIAIGVAAMVAVLGISASSQAKLEAQLSSLGTNLLTAVAADGGNAAGPLPKNAADRLARLPGVTATAAVGTLADTSVYRNQYVDPQRTGGVTVAAVDTEFLDVVAGEMLSGSWFDDTTSAFPTAVLGFEAASRLGTVEPGANVWLGDTLVTVIGIIEPLSLAPEYDSAALIGSRVAEAQFGWDGHPSVVMQRAIETELESVRGLTPAAIKPEQSGAVSVSRPSDALAAQQAVDDVFTSMLVGLGSISLLVGAIGVANTMVISVIERRKEIGLRRALGATRRHIRLQFVTEALVLSGLGGLAGVVIGAGVTFGVALANGWTPIVSVSVAGIAVVATLLVGAIAGLYPAVRASRTPPTAALSG